MILSDDTQWFSMPGRRHGLRWVALLTGLGLLPGCGNAGAAQQGPVTPANLVARLEAARGGERLVLSPGDYGRVEFPARKFMPAITLDARNARFSGLYFKDVDGVTVNGGAIVGPGGKSYGINIGQSANIRVEQMHISGAHRGAVVGNSRNVQLVGNTLTALISDGINIGSSWNVTIERNSCAGFTPRPAVYSPVGALLRDGDHPDCIQAWSRPNLPPTSDLRIVDNVVEGRMQGIFLGNHVRNGIDDGGFDRVVIRGNRITVGSTTGIRAGSLRDGEIIGNSVSSMPSVRTPKPPFSRVHAIIHVTGERNTVCGNEVADFPNAEPTRRCK